MRITKKQLKRIIKEERTRLLKEEQRGLTKEASTVSQEGELLGGLMTIINDLAVVEKELYGLVDQDRVDMGSVYGEELNVIIDELDAWREKLNSYFESFDDLAGRNPGGSIG